MPVKTEKDTEILLSELTRTSSLQQFNRKNDTHLSHPDPIAYLLDIASARGIRKAAVIKNSLIERTYAYHLMNGSKNPGRDHLIAFCRAGELVLEETQNVLKYACQRQLYARDRRDAAVIFGISNHYTVCRINLLLEELELPPLIT